MSYNIHLPCTIDARDYLELEESEDNPGHVLLTCYETWDDQEATVCVRPADLIRALEKLAGRSKK